VQAIEAVLFEPVGCLAEFSAEPFLKIIAGLSGGRKKASQSASRCYWHLLNSIESSNPPLDKAEALELQAAETAMPYEDVVPALTELKGMGIQLSIASSLSATAVRLFLERNRLTELFSAVWTRNNSGGVKAAPLKAACAGVSLKPEQAIFLTDTLEGLNTARAVGVHPVLMMNDPDEAKRLAMHDPAGGIVSLHELPDFLRLISAQNALRRAT